MLPVLKVKSIMIATKEAVNQLVKTLKPLTHASEEIQMSAFLDVIVLRD